MKAAPCLLCPAWRQVRHAEPAWSSVTVSGVRSNAGHVLLALCDRATFLQRNVPLSRPGAREPGPVTLRIAGVPPGVYAAQAFQDENDNGRIDRNLLGLPEEGIGFSNDRQDALRAAILRRRRVQPWADGRASIAFALRYFD